MLKLNSIALLTLSMSSLVNFNVFPEGSHSKLLPGLFNLKLKLDIHEFKFTKKSTSFFLKRGSKFIE